MLVKAACTNEVTQRWTASLGYTRTGVSPTLVRLAQKSATEARWRPSWLSPGGLANVLLTGLGFTWKRLLKWRRHISGRKLTVEFSSPAYLSESARLASEQLPCRVLAFYLVTAVRDPRREALLHKQWCRDHSIVGRVWVSSRGINAQVSGRTADCVQYAHFVAGRFPGVKGAKAKGASLLCKLDPVLEPAFPRLRVKAKKLISLAPELDRSLDMEDRGQDLEPGEWQRRMQGLESGKPGKVLDIRNNYEWDLGHFAPAKRPGTEELVEMSPSSLGLTSEDKDTPLYMYCTGGIRCEFFGAALRKKGFRQVYKLKGGVQHYGNTVGDEGWKGRLFVFDRRNSVAVGLEGSASQLACPICGGGVVEEFWNCANLDCNRRVVACRACAERLLGCCQECRHRQGQ
ncbi:trhO [Symbiodinium natans]|uniref:TrhO protein n=1 Tax=Symbiodinium natans TaxID=878477 RepID=A0A812L6W7_9DINO|nr:trhO [Symbiodinium natans]